MKPLILTLLFLPALTLGAAAQEAPFEGLRPGEVVKITFRSAAAVVGKVIALPRHALTIDLSAEHPGINGTLTVQRHDVSEVECRRIVVCGLVPKEKNR